MEGLEEVKEKFTGFKSNGGGFVEYWHEGEPKFGFRVPYLTSHFVVDADLMAREKKIKFGSMKGEVTVFRTTNGPPYVVEGNHMVKIGEFIREYNRTK